MQRTLIADLKKSIDEKVAIKGWVHNIRIMGNSLGFLTVRDRSGLVQVVIEDKADIEKFKSSQPGSVVYLSGQVAETEKTEQGVEIKEAEIEIVNLVDAPWPLEINKPDLHAHLDTILENRALTLRHPKLSAVFKIQGVMAQAYREYMIKNGFTEFFGPAMTASSSEGGAEIFKLKYFDGEATLAQSNQLYKQIMVGVYERVFGMAKWFRAENSNTRRHLTEGMQYEFEMGFIDSYHEVMDEAAKVIKYMLRQVEEKCRPELELLEVELVKLPSTETFPKITFADALQIHCDRTGEDTSDWDDLSTEAEKELCAYARENFDTDFIFVTNFPKGKFYAYKDEEGVYHNFDLLCREAEIISGGRRVDSYQVLVEEIKKEGMDPDSFSEYLSIFKYGMPPHGGFGLGFERFTMLALGLQNIREASLFPSDPKRVASQALPQVQATGADRIKKEIKQLFVDNDLEFEVVKHEPTPTSDDAAKVRGLALETGVKALILRNKKNGENILVAIPAPKKLNVKALASHYSGKLEFEKPERIKEKYGLIVGGVPPLGEVFGLQTFIDEGIFDIEISAFNNADPQESLICKSEDLAKIMDGITGKFTE
jgi:nondiscriminating aspartyl-tRNA synthetase